MGSGRLGHHGAQHGAAHHELWVALNPCHRPVSTPIVGPIDEPGPALATYPALAMMYPALAPPTVSSMLIGGPPYPAGLNCTSHPVRPCAAACSHT